MGKLLDNLNKYLHTHTEEEIRKSWDETKEYDSIGPTLEEFSKILKCTKRKYDKLSAMFALSQTRKLGKTHPERNKCRIYWCKECKAYHLTSKYKNG